MDIARLLPKKRLFSSSLAFAKTIDHYATTLRSRSRAEQAPAPVQAPAWLERLELAGEDDADDTRPKRKLSTPVDPT
ncbi:MAG: hypothetical protein JOY61_23870 [Chloroflexi bacterium]|nr:hypothetical protein [Chloroflexota bacterium]